MTHDGIGAQNVSKPRAYAASPTRAAEERHPCANAQDAINEVVRICQYMIGGRHTFEEIHVTKGKIEMKIARLGDDNKKQHDADGNVVTDTYTLHAD